jgi:hypothetical protein
MQSILKYLFSFIFLLSLLVYSGCEHVGIVPDPNEVDLPNQVQYGTVSDPIEGQYIVALANDDLLPETGLDLIPEIDDLIEALLEDLGIEENAVLFRYKHSLIGFSAMLNQDQLRQLEEDERVSYVEQNKIISLIIPDVSNLLDPILGNEDGQQTPYGIHRVGGPFDGTGMTTWVIDTGVDLNHNDLLVDRERSRSFVLVEPTSNDLNGHGTHVAGTIAALDNDLDVVGVAAGASVVGVKVLNALGIGSTAEVIAGIDYVAGNAEAGEVANMSLGGSASEALDDAVRNAADRGILFAIAAGNDSAHAENYSPARVVHNNVWTVSAVDEDDVFASFSNYGNPPVRFAAPGVDVRSLWLSNTTRTLSGTSMAAPHVAGILMISEGNPGSEGTAIDDPYGDPDPIVFYGSNE